MDSLRLAYLALSAGLIGFGGIWLWLGLRRGPAGRASRIAAALLLLLAAAGTAAAVILEGRAARPW